MTMLFDGSVWVHYGFIFVVPRGSIVDLDQTRSGQVNGLCGAAVPGALSLVTGLHTGLVPVRVEVLAHAPQDLGDWEDVVEASLSTPVTELGLAPFGDWYPFALPAPGDYRVRYSASGMDVANRQDTRGDDDPVTDRYLLQFWPASSGPDRVLRQSSQYAAYWHGVARDTPPPPPPATPEELAAAERVAAERGAAEREQALRRFAEARHHTVWGDLNPSPTLLALGDPAAQLARRDSELAEAVSLLTPAGLRALAVWAARAACERVADNDRLDWQAALTALEHGDPLPPPFDDHRRASRTLYGDGQRAIVVVRVDRHTRDHPARHQPIAAEAAALAAIHTAARENPVDAALGSLTQAFAGCPDPSGLARQALDYVATLQRT